MKKIAGPLVLMLAVAGCAADVHVAYPYPEPDAATGRVLIRFTEPMRQVNVQIDGALVADDEHTARVEIRDVPAGLREVEVAASEAHRSEAVHVTRTLDVRPGRVATVLVATPPIGLGYWTYMTMIALGTMAIIHF